MSTFRSDTASASPSSNALAELHLPVQVKLAAAWTSFMFCYVYVDYLALYKPGVIDEVRSGVVHDFATGPTFVGLSLTLLAVPILMIVCSVTLPARINRTLNLAAATLYIPFSIFNAAGESWSYAYFYGLSIGIEVLLLVFILRSAWTWRRRANDAPR